MILAILVPVVGVVVTDMAVVHAPGVEPLELPVSVVIVQLVAVLLLAPVNISSLRGKPANIQGNEDDAGSHDDKQGLQSNVMLDGREAETLRRSIILHTTSLAKEVGMLRGRKNFAQKHFFVSCRSESSNI